MAELNKTTLTRAFRYLQVYMQLLACAKLSLRMTWKKCWSFVLPSKHGSRSWSSSQVSSHFIRLHQTSLGIAKSWRLGWGLLYFWKTVLGTFTLGIATFSGEKTGCIADSYSTCRFSPPFSGIFHTHLS